MILTQNAQVLGLEGDTLTVGFTSEGARSSFVNGKQDEILAQAVVNVVGAQWKINAIVAPGADPGAVAPGPSGTPAPAAPAPAPAPVEPAPTPPTPSAPNPAVEAARQQIVAAGEQAPPPPWDAPDEPDWVTADAAAGFDDEVTDEVEGSEELLRRELGATVIEEIPHEQ